MCLSRSLVYGGTDVSFLISSSFIFMINFSYQFSMYITSSVLLPKLFPCISDRTVRNHSGNYLGCRWFNRMTIELHRIVLNSQIIITVIMVLWNEQINKSVICNTLCKKWYSSVVGVNIDTVLLDTETHENIFL